MNDTEKTCHNVLKFREVQPPRHLYQLRGYGVGGTDVVLACKAPWSWDLIVRETGVCEKVEAYDEVACRFLDKSKPFATKRVTLMPPLVMPVNLDWLLTEAVRQLTEVLGDEIEQDSIGDDVCAWVSEITGFHTYWIRELHEFYLRHCQKKLRETIALRPPRKVKLPDIR